MDKIVLPLGEVFARICFSVFHRRGASEIQWIGRENECEGWMEGYSRLCKEGFSVFREDRVATHLLMARCRAGRIAWGI